MHTVRRLYVYLLSGVALAVLLIGLNLLLTVAFGALGLGRGPFIGGSPTADRDQLSLAAALTVVGLLVWGSHWWFAERSVRAGQPDAAEEHGAGLRALYLTLVLGALLAFGATAALTLLDAVIRFLLGISAVRTDVAGSLATFVVAGVAWTYHVRVRSRDLSTRVDGPAAWLPRLYLYGAALAGLVLLAFAVSTLLAVALDALLRNGATIGGTSVSRDAAAWSIASVLAWSAVWIGHWWYASRLLSVPGWRSAAERLARLRVAYYAGALAAATLGVLWYLSEALRVVAADLLGATESVGLATAGTAAAVGAALLAALVWLVLGLVHRSWMRHEALEQDDLSRSATVDRLDAGLMALIGLAFAAVGVAWLAGIAVDALFGGSRTRVGDFWLAELSRYLALAVVGIGPWVWNWGRLQRRAAADPAQEAASPVRRSLLLLVIGVAVLASIGSLAVVLYRLFGALLGAGLTDNVTALSTPLGVLLVAGATAAYHAMVLRRDQHIRGEAMPAETEPAPPPVQDAQAGRAALVLRLSGPDGVDLNVALGTLRAHLPPGYLLEADEGSVSG